MNELRKILFMTDEFGIIYNYQELIIIQNDHVTYYKANNLKDLVIVNLLMEKYGLPEPARNAINEQITDLEFEYERREEWIDRNKENFWVKP